MSTGVTLGVWAQEVLGDSRSAVRGGQLVAERILGDSPDEVRRGLDVLGERTLVWVHGAVHEASDVVADLGPRGDVLARLDDDAGEVVADHAAFGSEIPVDDCTGRHQYVCVPWTLGETGGRGRTFVVGGIEGERGGLHEDLVVGDAGYGVLLDRNLASLRRRVQCPID